MPTTASTATRRRSRPDVPSGCLAEWDGKAEHWTVVRRNQFTEVTGPGGISGNPHPGTDPIWSIGWDHRSLILMLLDGGEWHAYRLPKASHCYDGAHGWNTEWPRIRDIGERDLLMTMHGMFWRFPKTFSPANSAGIAPALDLSQGHRRLLPLERPRRLRLRRHREERVPQQAQSQRRARRAGPVAIEPVVRRSRRAWTTSASPSGAARSGWTSRCGPIRPPSHSSSPASTRRSVHLAHTASRAGHLQLRGGPPRQRAVDAAARSHCAGGRQPMDRIRERPSAAPGCASAPIATARRRRRYSTISNADRRGTQSRPAFSPGWPGFRTKACPAACSTRGAATPERCHSRRCGAQAGAVAEAGLYELDGDLKLRRVDDAPREAWLKQNAAIPRGVLTVDAASVLFVDDAGQALAAAQRRRGFRSSRPAGRCARGPRSLHRARPVQRARHLLRVAGRERGRLRQDPAHRHAQPPHSRLLLLPRLARDDRRVGRGGGLPAHHPLRRRPGCAVGRRGGRPVEARQTPRHRRSVEQLGREGG